MIEYLYHGTYTAPEAFADQPTCTTFHITVLQLADKYDIPVLAKMAADRMVLSVKKWWASSALLDVIEYLYDSPSNPLVANL